MRRPITLAALAALAAGCGGGDEPAAAEPTRACLEEAGLRAAPSDDFIASTAAGGGLRATIGENAVTIAFGSSEEDARQLAEGYRRVAPGGLPIDRLLQVEDNVVLIWAGEPAPADAERVRGCLRGPD
jgi:hypothetical protein